MAENSVLHLLRTENSKDLWVKGRLEYPIRGIGGARSDLEQLKHPRERELLKKKEKKEARVPGQ